MFLDICNRSGFLEIVAVIKGVITVIQIVVPILLILFASIDLTKMVLNPENKEKKIIINRFLSAVIVFFIPVIINAVMNLANNYQVLKSDCWVNANSQTIKYLKAQEKEEEGLAYQTFLKKVKEEQAKATIIDKMYIANVNILKKVQSGDGALTIADGSDGSVRVDDGKFYVPKDQNSGMPASKGTGEYGLNITFWNMLETFFAAAAKDGHTISVSDGWRSYERQVTTKKNKGSYAATPGKSNHGWGIAADLAFSTTKARDWAHSHCNEYGMRFSVCKNYFGGNCKENWHIEPLVIVKE